MKVLIVTYEFPPIIGGAGVYAHDLAIGLSSNNCDVTIISYNHNDKTNVLKEYLLNDFKINLKTFKPLKGLHFIQFAYSIIKELNINEFDFIVLSDGRAKKVFALFGPLLNKYYLKSISIFHGDEINSFFITPSRAIKWSGTDKMLLKLFNKQKLLITVSSNQESLWKNKFPSFNDKIVTIKHGVNENQFKPLDLKFVDNLREKLNISKSVKVITSASRLKEKKGQDNLLNAFASVLKKHNNTILLIIGNGEYLDALKIKSIDLKIADKVMFLGGVDRSKLPLYYNMTDIFVLPSRYHESFGLVYLEAAACNVPSIAGNLGGVSDAIQDGITGFLVDSFSVNELEDKLNLLLEDEKLRHRMGNNARNRFLETFTSTKMAFSLLSNVKKYV